MYKKNDNSGEISDVVIVFRKKDGTSIGLFSSCDKVKNLVEGYFVNECTLPSHSFFRVFNRDFMFYFFIISSNQTVKPELVIKNSLLK